MRTATLTHTLATGVIAGLVLTGCGPIGGDDPAVDAEGDAQVVEGTDDSDGGESPAAGEDDGTPAETAFPVSGVYAGMTWTVTGADLQTQESGTVLSVDVEVAHEWPFGLRYPAGVFSVRTPAGDKFEAYNGIQVAGDAKSTETLEFYVDRDLDIPGLSLVIEETGKIPEVIPFAGGAEENPYPIEATFDGTTKALQNIGTAGFDHTTVVTAVWAGVGVDSPGWGRRASRGNRLVVLEFQLEQRGANAHIGTGPFRLEGDGQRWAPVEYVGGDLPEANTTETVTHLYEVPSDVSELALVVTTKDGSDSDRLPIGFDAPLPPCCGE